MRCRPGASLSLVRREQVRPRLPSIEQTSRRVPRCGTTRTSTGEFWIGAAESPGAAGRADPASVSASSARPTTPSL